MSTPYSIRLGTGTTTADNTPVTLGTVPAGKRWIVREWVVAQTGAGTCRSVLIHTGSNGFADITDQMAQNAGVARTQRHIVLNAGDTINFRARTTTAPIILSCTAYGYELDAP